MDCRIKGGRHGPRTFPSKIKALGFAPIVLSCSFHGTVHILPFSRYGAPWFSRHRMLISTSPSSTNMWHQWWTICRIPTRRPFQIRYRGNNWRKTSVYHIGTGLGGNHRSTSQKLPRTTVILSTRRQSSKLL